MLVGAAAGGKDSLQPLRGLQIGGVASAGAHVSFQRIKTVADLDRELAAARAAGRPVMLDFYADWCVSCKEMEHDTFTDPRVIRELDRFVVLQADVTANDAADQALMQGRYRLHGPPAMLFFSPAGDELRHLRMVGFTPAAEFIQHLRRIGP
jgi:thiol:disulfide interchange protein DsbD